MIEIETPDFGQLVRSVWGQDISDEAVDDLLWGTTPYPAGSPDQVHAQLVAYHARSNGNITEALKLAVDDLCDVMRQHHAEFQRVA